MTPELRAASTLIGQVEYRIWTDAPAIQVDVYLDEGEGGQSIHLIEHNPPQRKECRGSPLDCVLRYKMDPYPLDRAIGELILAKLKCTWEIRA